MGLALVLGACSGSGESTDGDPTPGDGGGGGTVAETGGVTSSGGADGGVESGGADPVEPCDPGATRTCFGPDRCAGTQRCNVEGAWSACDCGASTGGATGSGGTAPSDGGTPGAGGADPLGGVPGAGGSLPTGGVAATGGTVPTGGIETTGGTMPTGGTAPTGGTLPTGGVETTGGTLPTGGVETTGGALPTGGGAPTGGAPTGGTTTGGAPTGGASNGGAETCDTGTVHDGGTEYCANAQGEVGNGYSYMFWTNGGESTCMTVFGDEATFRANWTEAGDVLNLVGLKYDATRTPDQIGRFSSDFAFTKSGSSGSAYLGLFGRTDDPVVEFYIIEDWLGSTRPAFNPSKGTIVVDGGTYDVYESAVSGTTIIRQYFSVRTEARQCGHTSISEHFAEWAARDMPMGNLNEVMLLVEGFNGTGEVEFTKGTVTLE